MSEPVPHADLRRRFRRLLGITAGVALLTLAVVFGSLWLAGVELRLHFVIALSLGITFSLLLAGGLMGLVFLSSRSGHDDSIRDRPE